MTRSMLAFAIVAGLAYLGVSAILMDAAEPEAAEVIKLTWEQLKFDGPTKDKPFERAMLGKAIEKLDGKQVRIQGYILPGVVGELSQFVFIHDRHLLCPPRQVHHIYDYIIVTMVGDKKVQYVFQPFTVTGKFTIKEFRDNDGVIRAVYHIDADSAGGPKKTETKQP